MVLQLETFQGNFDGIIHSLETQFTSGGPTNLSIPLTLHIFVRLDVAPEISLKFLPLDFPSVLIELGNNNIFDYYSNQVKKFFFISKKIIFFFCLQFFFDSKKKISKKMNNVKNFFFLLRRQI